MFTRVYLELSNDESISWAILTCMFDGSGIWKRGIADYVTDDKFQKRQIIQGIRYNSLFFKIAQVIFYHY